MILLGQSRQFSLNNITEIMEVHLVQRRDLQMTFLLMKICQLRVSPRIWDILFFLKEIFKQLQQVIQDIAHISTTLMKVRRRFLHFLITEAMQMLLQAIQQSCRARSCLISTMEAYRTILLVLLRDTTMNKMTHLGRLMHK